MISTFPAPSSSYATAVVEERKRVLVVEADPVIAEMLVWAFHLEGYLTTLASVNQTTTTDWVQQMVVAPPALLLLDLDSVGALMEPVSMLRRILARLESIPSREMFPRFPLLLLTDKFNRQFDLEQEGYPVITKPLHIKALLSMSRLEIDRHEKSLLKRHVSGYVSEEG